MLNANPIAPMSSLLAAPTTRQTSPTAITRPAQNNPGTQNNPGGTQTSPGTQNGTNTTTNGGQGTLNQGVNAQPAFLTPANSSGMTPTPNSGLPNDPRTVLGQPPSTLPATLVVQTPQDAAGRQIVSLLNPDGQQPNSPAIAPRTPIHLLSAGGGGDKPEVLADNRTADLSTEEPAAPRETPRAVAAATDAGDTTPAPESPEQPDQPAPDDEPAPEEVSLPLLDSLYESVGDAGHDPLRPSESALWLMTASVAAAGFVGMRQTRPRRQVTGLNLSGSL